MIKLEKNKDIGWLTFHNSSNKVEGSLEDNSTYYFELCKKEEVISFYNQFSTPIKDIPDNIEIRLYEDQEDEYTLSSLFRFGGLKKVNGILYLDVISWGAEIKHIDYKDYVYYRLMVEEAKKLKSKPAVEYEERDGIEDHSTLVLTFSHDNCSKTLLDIINNEIIPDLKILQNVIDQKINDFNWNDDYDKNEKTFSLELLQPLFLKMGFEKVKYNHGNKEFGKDFILSKINEFGIEEYYGVQVKAGKISGQINSKIDELIGQCKDSFSIPWQDIKSEKHFISKIVIATSGNFTDNAIAKIKYKLPDYIKSNIIFLDKDLIVSLNRKFLNK